ncbi:MAG TPA: hypothetical protein VMP13_02140 [Acidimicrobiia bacterium]|nr:hypothetical protein [Acidimicrobiia bacterium]
MRALSACLLLVAVACNPAGETPAGNGTAAGCTEPTPEEIEKPSQLEMLVEPDPVTPKQVVDLVVTPAGLPDSALAGVDAAWQCWDGTRWVTTHIVYRGFGDNAGQTIPVNANFQIRVPSIGLELDQGYPIVIPPVDPGRYRIEDEIIVDDDAVPGHVIVEVLPG